MRALRSSNVDCAVYVNLKKEGIAIMRKLNKKFKSRKYTVEAMRCYGCWCGSCSGSMNDPVATNFLANQTLYTAAGGGLAMLGLC